MVFDPWQQETWDVNDTVRTAPSEDPDVGEFFRRLPEDAYLPTWYGQRIDGARGAPEQSAAEKAARHASTPTLAHFDTLGRPFLTIAHNGKDESGEDVLYETRTILDIEGNQREVIDAKGRIVMRYDYDMLGNRIHQASMEAGERWMLGDVAGNPIGAWDSRGHHFRTDYDALRRVTQQVVEGTDAERSDPRTLSNPILYQKLVYGEELPAGREAAAAQNLLTRVWKQFDGAGVVASAPYDFKGNLVRSSRRLVKDYKAIPNWQSFPEPEDRPEEWEDEVFQSSTLYDALNRPIQLVAPHTGGETDVIRPGYNEANLLERVDVWLKYAGEPAALLLPDTSDQHFVTNIDYNAKGQRTLIEYGNGTSTRYTYDTETFRLIHLHTTRPLSGSNSLNGELFVNPTTVQDLLYTYDPAGNITGIRDDALPVIHYDNGEVHPVSNYTYDAIYRLITAEGREHIGQTVLLFDCPNNDCRDYPFTGLRVHPNDRQAVRNYTEYYDYDGVGNFRSMHHQVRNGGWSRSYEYLEPSLIEPNLFRSNRLSRTTVDGRTQTYTYDEHGHGSITSMPNLAQMDWDFMEQLQRVDLGGGGTVYYVYDATGQRVRKVIERLNGSVQKERIYLGGFEVYREYNGGGEENLILERETLHLMDDQQRIAMVETRTEGVDEAPRQLIRYQLGNHLGSASLELDAVAQVISYEEYHPYGTPSYQAVRSQTETPKRYRYTGMERDEETGVNYQTARYYAPWLGMWVSPDPIAAQAGNSLYNYCRNNPINLTDASGLDYRLRLSESPVLRPPELHLTDVNFDPPTGNANLLFGSTSSSSVSSAIPEETGHGTRAPGSRRNSGLIRGLLGLGGPVTDVAMSPLTQYGLLAGLGFSAIIGSGGSIFFALPGALAFAGGTSGFFATLVERGLFYSGEISNQQSADIRGATISATGMSSVGGMAGALGTLLVTGSEEDLRVGIALGGLVEGAALLGYGGVRSLFGRVPSRSVQNASAANIRFGFDPDGWNGPLAMTYERAAFDEQCVLYTAGWCSTPALTPQQVSAMTGFIGPMRLGRAEGVWRGLGLGQGAIPTLLGEGFSPEIALQAMRNFPVGTRFGLAYSHATGGHMIGVSRTRFGLLFHDLAPTASLFPRATYLRTAIRAWVFPVSP